MLLSRGERGTWLIDLKVRWGSGYRSLQIPIGKHRAIDRLAWELKRSQNPSREPQLQPRADGDASSSPRRSRLRAPTNSQSQTSATHGGLLCR